MHQPHCAVKGPSISPLDLKVQHLSLSDVSSTHTCPRGPRMGTSAGRCIGTSAGRRRDEGRAATASTGAVWWPRRSRGAAPSPWPTGRRHRPRIRSPRPSPADPSPGRWERARGPAGARPPARPPPGASLTCRLAPGRGWGPATESRGRSGTQAPAARAAAPGRRSWWEERLRHSASYRNTT